MLFVTFCRLRIPTSRGAAKYAKPNPTIAKIRSDLRFRAAIARPSLAPVPAGHIIPAMYRIIGGDGREYGPVAPAQIEQWIAQNRANATTRIKPEGAAAWTTLAELPEFAAAFSVRAAPPPLPGDATAQPPAPAAEPAQTSASPDAGFTVAPADDPVEAARACLNRPYRLSIMDTLSRGWDILASRFWLVAGATTVALLASMAAGMLPIVGIAASILLTQVFYAGIYWLMLRVSRGEPAEFADVFGGFSRSFGQLVLLSLTTFCCTLVLAAIAMGPLLWALYRSGAFAGVEPDPTQLLGPLLALPVLMLPLLYFSISWLFAPLLVVDRGMGFWEAMETSRRMIGKRWFRMFFLYLAFIPLMIAGLLCFIVGMFVVLALMYAAMVAAYETAFRPESGRQGTRSLSSTNPRA